MSVKSDYSVSMLRPQPKRKAQLFTTVKLLIVAVSSADVRLIIQTLNSAKIVYLYDTVSTDKAYQSLLRENTYDAVLLSYYPEQESGSLSPLNILHSLQQSRQDIPLILLSEALGEEKVVEFLKAGITDYISFERLFHLPENLKQALISFAQKRQKNRKIAQIHRLAKQQTIINCIIQWMRETLILDDILQNTVDLIDEILSVTSCLILQSDTDNQGRFHYISQSTPQGENLLDFGYQVLHHYHSSLIQGKPLILTPIDETLPIQLRGIASNYQVESIIIVPMFFHDSYLGGICLYNSQFVEEWTENELTIVRSVATQCAIAIHQAQIFAQVKQQKQREQLLNQIIYTINSSLDQEKILQEIVQQIGKAFDVDRVVIFRLYETQIHVQKEWRINNQITSLLDIKASLFELPELLDPNCEYHKDHCFNSSHYVVSPEIEVQEEITHQTKYYNSLSVLSVPIVIHEQLFGGLALHTITKKRTFTPEDIQTIERIAQQTAIALYNARSYEYLEKQFREFRDRNQQLEQERERSEAASRAKSEFLSTMSHELRTPLTGILGFSRMLMEEIYGSLNPKQMQYINAIASSGEHLLELINDLLDISKIEADREELFLEKVPVEDICLASMSIVQERARQEGLALKLEIEPNIHFCIADQRRLKQVLVNLLSNAVKFTETGSVTLKVKSQGQNLNFCVIDTGIGISEADQKKLFQPFQQLRNNMSFKYKGTGLGLALSRKLAKLHGGDLTLMSEEGKGSCFTLHLPI